MQLKSSLLIASNVLAVRTDEEKKGKKKSTSSKHKAYSFFSNLTHSTTESLSALQQTLCRRQINTCLYQSTEKKKEKEI